MSVETATPTQEHSATMAKFRVAGSHANGAEQSFRMEGVGPTETDPAFFDGFRLARNHDGSKSTVALSSFAPYTGSRSPLAQFSIVSAMKSANRPSAIA